MIAIVPNTGLDVLCQTFLPELGFYYAGVGTSATPKTVTSTGLGAEVARVYKYGSGNNPTAGPSGGSLVYTVLSTHIFNFSNSQNLNEYAYYADQTTSTATALELFRDAGGNAVTVSIPAGGQLQLNLTLTVSFPLWGVAAITTNISGVGNVPAHHTLYASTNDYISAARSCWPAYANVGFTASILTASLAPGTGANPAGQVTGKKALYLTPYTGGTYYRDKVYVLDPVEYAGPVYGLCASESEGYMITFDTPINKSNTQRLTLPIRCTLSRPG